MGIDNKKVTPKEGSFYRVKIIKKAAVKTNEYCVFLSNRLFFVQN